MISRAGIFLRALLENIIYYPMVKICEMLQHYRLQKRGCMPLIGIHPLFIIIIQELQLL